MRCRYSRRLYLLKSQFHNPDYLDDSDLTFLENLISLHSNYVNNCCKRIDIDSSLLPKEYQIIFNEICTNYSLIRDSSVKTELYSKFDLEYRGEERHARSLREEIITYLQQKKGNIFTQRRVEFFLKLAMTTKLDELRKLCKEMLFSIKSPRRPIPGKRNKDNNNTRSSFVVSEDNTQLADAVHSEIIPLEQMETLFLPYLTMIHPLCVVDYDKVSAMINDSYPDEIADIIKTSTNLIDDNTDFVDLTTNSSTKQLKSTSLDTINGIDRHMQPKRSIIDENISSKNQAQLKPSIPIKSMPVLTDIFDQSNNQTIAQPYKMNLRQRCRHSVPNKVIKATHSKESNHRESLPLDSPRSPSPLKTSKPSNTEKKELSDERKHRLTQSTVLSESAKSKTHSRESKHRESLPLDSPRSPSPLHTIQIPKHSNTENKELSEEKKHRLRQSTELSESAKSNIVSSRKRTAIQASQIVQFNGDDSISSRNRMMRQSHQNYSPESPPALTDSQNQSTVDSAHHQFIPSSMDEVIEISDDEDDVLKKSIIPKFKNISEMIEYLIHNCSIRSQMHPSLLKNHQLRIELNGFLLLVNLAIRLSLKVGLDQMRDSRTYDCLFIASVRLGIQCSVCVKKANGAGILTIGDLSAEDCHIAIARLSSMQVAVVKRDPERLNDKYSITSRPDIRRLVELALVHVHNYQATGHLAAGSDPAKKDSDCH